MTTRRLRSLRRTTPAAAATIALTLGLAACTGSSTGATGSTSGQTQTADPTAPVALTWWTGQTAQAEKVLDSLAKEYTKAHPNVTITVSPGAATTDDLKQKVAAGFVSDTYPDISYAYGSWATDLGQSGHTLDLTAAVAKPEVAWSEFPPAATATATVDSKVIGVPALVDNLGLIYNKTLFDAAGVAYPTNDWTWDDFRAAAKKLTNPGDKIFGTGWSVSGSEDTTCICGRCCGRRAARSCPTTARVPPSTPTPAFRRWTSCARWRSTTSPCISTRPTRSMSRCSSTVASR